MSDVSAAIERIRTITAYLMALATDQGVDARQLETDLQIIESALREPAGASPARP